MKIKKITRLKNCKCSIYQKSLSSIKMRFKRFQINLEFIFDSKYIYDVISLNASFVHFNYEFPAFFHHSFLQWSPHLLRMTFSGLIHNLWDACNPNSTLIYRISEQLFRLHTKYFICVISTSKIGRIFIHFRTPFENNILNTKKNWLI